MSESQLKSLAFHVTQDQNTKLKQIGKLLGKSKPELTRMLLKHFSMRKLKEGYIVNNQEQAFTTEDAFVNLYIDVETSDLLLRCARYTGLRKDDFVTLLFKNTVSLAEVLEFASGNLEVANINEFLELLDCNLTEVEKRIKTADWKQKTELQVQLNLPDRIMNALWGKYRPVNESKVLKALEDAELKTNTYEEIEKLLPVKIYNFGYGDKLSMESDLPGYLLTLTPVEIMQRKIVIRYLAKFRHIFYTAIPDDITWNEILTVWFNQELTKVTNWKEFASEFEPLWKEQLAMIGFLFHEIKYTKVTLQQQNLWNKEELHKLMTILIKGPFLQGLGVFENTDFMKPDTYLAFENTQLRLETWEKDIEETENKLAKQLEV